MSIGTFLLIAIAGSLFLEGAAMALFPSFMRKAWSEMANESDKLLRGIGLGCAALAVLLVWLFLPKS